MKTLAFLAVMVALTGPLYAADNSCPEYTCGAMLVPLASGGYVVQGRMVLPMTWYQERPAATYVLLIVNGDVVQTVPLHWSSRHYFCCCPSDWLGEFADRVFFSVTPGDRVLIVFGEERLCETEVVVPPKPAPALNPDRDGIDLETNPAADR